MPIELAEDNEFLEHAEHASTATADSLERYNADQMQFTFFLSSPLAVGHIATWLAVHVGAFTLSPDDRPEDARWKMTFTTGARAIIVELRDLVQTYEVDVMMSRRP